MIDDPNDRAATLKENRRVQAGGKALRFENRYLCKDGSFRWSLWNAAADEGLGMIYSVARDITLRKEADEERNRLVRELQSAVAEVKLLQKYLPICSYCRKVRDDEDYWHTVESYVSQHMSVRFSHSICPDCLASEVDPHFDEASEGSVRWPISEHVRTTVAPDSFSAIIQA